MIDSPAAPVRRRRTLATVAAAALALAGLVSMPTAAQAAADPTVSISPSTLAPNSDATVTVTITGGSAKNVAAADIIFPAGYTAISAGPAPTGWTQGLASSPNRLLLTVDDNNDKLGDGESITQTLSLHTPATSGPTTWNVDTWSNNGRNGAKFTASSTATIANPAQTITFGPLSDKTFGDADFTVSATSTGGSGNPVTFSTSGDCTSGGTNGATIHLTGAGSCSVTANQAGGNGFQAATPVTRTFNIAKAGQTITFPAITTPTFGDAPITLGATASSGLTVSYTTTGSCSVSGDQLSFTGGGLCRVNADQAGDANYNAAPQVFQEFTVNKAGATLALDDLTHTYDGDSHGATVTTTPDGLAGVSVTYDGSATVPTDAGSYAVVATLDHPDYAGTVSGTLVINRKHITGDFTVADKVYDGTAEATVTNRTLVGAILGDDVSLVEGTATFDSKNAGNRIATLSGGSLSGTDAGNYELDGVDTATATISQAPVTASIMAGDKEYDGNDSAVIEDKDLSGVLDPDDVDIADPDAHFSDKNVGENKTVSATIELVGDDKDNYYLTDTSVTTTATIFAKQLVGSFTAENKVYDGTTAATVSGTSLPGVVDGETVSLVVAGAAFDTKDVGTGKTVTGVLSLAGDHIGNYVLSGSSDSTATADITAKALTGSVTAENKVYDGTTTATATPDGLTGIVGDEDVALVVDSASFDNRNVGTDKNVTAYLSLSGPDASNYTVNLTATAQADITAKSLTATIVADDKVYDGGTDAGVTPDLDGVVVGDTVTVSAVGTFADKNVGTDKTVTASITIGGADAGNYSVNASATDTADITALEVSGTITADNKVYDGTTAATVHPSVTGAVVGDDLSISAVGTFADKNVGTGKTVTATLSLGGTDAGNYSVNPTATTTADITPATVNGSFTAADKVWDGTNAATITGRSLGGVIDPDDVQLNGGTATFDNANVGNNKTVFGAGFSLSGVDAGNYQLASSSLTTTASIVPLYSGTGFYKPVDMTPAGGTRIYNTIKGGQTVPLKFEIFNATTLVEQTSLSIFGSDAAAQAAAFTVNKISCTSTSSEVDPIELVTTGATSLRYDTTAGQFIQNWKTPTTTGQCYTVSVKTVDGTTVGPAYFKITK